MLAHIATRLKANDICKRMTVESLATELKDRTARTSTTSFLTATTLIYAIGAGITAAAGTRLALQLILNKGCKFISFQSRI